MFGRPTMGILNGPFIRSRKLRVRGTQRSDLSVLLVEMIVCRYGNPGAVAARIVIGVTAPALLAVGKAGVKARMDDREITQQADSHVLGHKPADRHRLRHQLEI